MQNSFKRPHPTQEKRISYQTHGGELREKMQMARFPEINFRMCFKKTCLYYIHLFF